MKILFTGRDNKGTWQIRAVQIAEARSGWQAIPEDRLGKVSPITELVIVVKRFRDVTIEALRRWGGPVLWDAQDCWPKLNDVVTSPESARAYFGMQAGRLPGLVGMIGATARMTADIGGLATIYHHHRPDARPAEFSRRVMTVGYEGNEAWLGRWKPALDRACERRGWQFMVNPASWNRVDLGVALRDDPYRTYAHRHFKSNVKLANLMVRGVPAICGREDGYLETAAEIQDAVTWLDDFDERALDDALTRAGETWFRRYARDAMLAQAPRFHRDVIAGQYEALAAAVPGMRATA